MRHLLKLSALVVVATASSAVQAHDFFLLPAQFNLSQPGRQEIQATVGSSFPKPEAVVTADRVDRLYAEGVGKPQLDVAGPGANALKLSLTVTSPGTVVAAVKTKDRDVEYAEDRIPLILGEYRVSPEAVAAVDGLPKPRTLKVSSRRFAKTFLCVQECADRSAAARPLGADLEFVSSGGAADHFRLLSLGKPLADYPIDLVTTDGKRLHLTTDGSGELHLPADAKGAMMLFAAVMVPPAGGERFTLNLSTLTFSLP